MKIADARQFPVEQRGNLAAILVEQIISGPIVAVEHDEFAGVGHGLGEPLTRERYHRTRLTFVDIPKLAPVIIGPARRLLEIGVGYFETGRSEEHTSELQSLMRISYAVFCLKKKKKQK